MVQITIFVAQEC